MYQLLISRSRMWEDELTTITMNLITKTNQDSYTELINVCIVLLHVFDHQAVLNDA